MPEQNQLAVVGDSLDVITMEQAIAFSSKMSEAKLLPAHLQKSPADCLRVVLQAARWRMDPFSVADKTSVISGKLMYEGQLVTAVVNSRGNLSKRLDYTFHGEGDARVLTVSGTIKGESEPRTIDLPFTLAKKINRNGQMAINPDQQATYIGARIWARRHMPELMLGVYVPDEMPDDVDPKNVTPSTETPAGDPANGSAAPAESTTPRRGRPPGRSTKGVAAVTETPAAPAIDVQATTSAQKPVDPVSPNKGKPEAPATLFPPATTEPVTTLIQGESKSFVGCTVEELIPQNFALAGQASKLGVKAVIDGPFKGTVYDSRAGSAAWIDDKDPTKGVKAMPPWQLDHPVNVTLKGKPRSDGSIACVVEAAELTPTKAEAVSECP
jgi:hypothetical protein